MDGRGRGRRSELIGRQEELARIGRLIDGLRDGRGGALRIDGEPGVGKSALIDAAAREDITCLRATGVEIELELPLAALDELLAGLPGEAGPDRTEADPAERLREAAALIERSAPLIVLVDDLQWMDASSRGAIAYLARRAERLGIVLIGVWSLRGDPPDEWPGVEAMRLGELSRADAVELARSQGLADQVAESIVSMVGGNPLALIEAPAGLAPEQRRGGALLPKSPPVVPSLQAAYATRLRRLDPETSEYLLLAAAGAPDHLVAGRLGAAEDLGLVRLGASCEFVHPLMRSAVYHAAPPSARRRAHRRIAEGVEDPERTRQLALAAEGPDEELASRLADLASRAEEAGAPGTAASMLEWSAGLSVSPEARASRALDGARVALVAGRPATALELIGLAGERSASPEATLLKGTAVYLAGRPRDARALLEAEAGRIADEQPEAASVLLVQACVALMGPGPTDDLESLARRALELAAPESEAMPGVALAAALTVRGKTAEARDLLERYEASLAGWDPTGPGHEVLAVAGFCWFWLGELDRATVWLERLVEADRSAGAESVLAAPLAILAGTMIRSGRLIEAELAAREASEIVETGLGGFGLTLALSIAALAAAVRGDERACREGAERIFDLEDASDSTAILAAAEQALGQLELSLGNPRRAVEHLERVAVHLKRHGTVTPTLLFNDVDLVEALVRLGSRDEARTALRDLRERAVLTGDRWSASAVERCLGLLAPADEIEAHLAASLEILGEGYMPLEEARTRLALGERLIRAGRDAAGRREIGAARDAFERMGAEQWAKRAALELDAPRGTEGEALTARERDVCVLVAGGSTNRETAEALVLSTRTVEAHLRSVYRKLGVRSRSELAATWRD